jgi:hypothetical protein
MNRIRVTGLSLNKIRVTAVILFYSIHLTHWISWICSCIPVLQSNHKSSYSRSPSSHLNFSISECPSTVTNIWTFFCKLCWIKRGMSAYWHGDGEQSDHHHWLVQNYNMQRFSSRDTYIRVSLFLAFVRNCSGPLAGDFCSSKLEEISEALVKLIKRRISSNDMKSFSIHVLSIRHTIKGILWSWCLLILKTRRRRRSCFTSMG